MVTNIFTPVGGVCGWQ